MGGVGGGALTLMIPIVVAGLATESLGLLDELLAVCVASMPLAIAAAILRYRLYDLDRIISRTLTYGLLTVVLGGGYAGVVLGLGQLLGRDSPLLVAGATLAVAALFGPTRRRTQDLVDRRRRLGSPVRRVGSGRFCYSGRIAKGIASPTTGRPWPRSRLLIEPYAIPTVGSPRYIAARMVTKP